MDANKLKVLRDIKYTIPPTCGLCRFSRFDENRSGVSQWGTCTIMAYEHRKHGTQRELSIFRGGVCPEFKVNPSEVQELEGFAEFAPTK